MFTSITHMLMQMAAMFKGRSVLNQLTLAESAPAYHGGKTTKRAHTRSGAAAIKRASKKARNRKRSK